MTTTTDPIVIPVPGSCEKDMIQEIADAIHIEAILGIEGDGSVAPKGLSAAPELNLLSTEIFLDTTELFHDHGDIPTGRTFYVRWTVHNNISDTRYGGEYQVGITLDPTWHDPEYPKRFRYEVELL